MSEPATESTGSLPPGTVATPTALRFDELVARLQKAVTDHGLLLIASPSASRNAASRQIAIPGNAVLLAFNNDFALRLLGTSVAAGFEAPMRFYVTESADGTATVTYRQPSVLLAAYGNPALDPLGEDLDRLFAQVVAAAVA